MLVSGESPVEAISFFVSHLPPLFLFSGSSFYSLVSRLSSLSAYFSFSFHSLGLSGMKECRDLGEDFAVVYVYKSRLTGETITETWNFYLIVYVSW